MKAAPTNASLLSGPSRNADGVAGVAFTAVHRRTGHPGGQIEVRVATGGGGGTITSGCRATRARASSASARPAGVLAPHICDIVVVPATARPAVAVCGVAIPSVHACRCEKKKNRFGLINKTMEFLTAQSQVVVQSIECSRAIYRNAKQEATCVVTDNNYCRVKLLQSQTLSTLS